MKRADIVVRTGLLACAVVFLLLVLLRWPILTTIEFEGRGETGSELIRVSAAKGFVTLLPDSPVDRGWKKYRFERVWMPLDIRIYFLNQSGPNEPTRVLYIKEGIVKLYGFNIFGQHLVTKDILDINSEYRGPEGKKLFPVESVPMATIRGGITGWSGYYELTP